jgi:hypothetical protein
MQQNVSYNGKGTPLQIAEFPSAFSFNLCFTTDITDARCLLTSVVLTLMLPLPANHIPPHHSTQHFILMQVWKLKEILKWSRADLNLHSVPRLRMREAMPPVPLDALMNCVGELLLIYLFIMMIISNVLCSKFRFTNPPLSVSCKDFSWRETPSKRQENDTSLSWAFDTKNLKVSCKDLTKGREVE